MGTALILAFSVCSGIVGEICLTHAMKCVGEAREFSPPAIARFVLRALRVGWLWIGVGLMTASFYALLMMLSWYPISFVVPATSVGYVIGALGAKFFLGEQLSATRWAGVALICLGVVLSWVDRMPPMPKTVTVGLVARDAVFALAVMPLIFYLLGIWAAWRFFGPARRRAGRPGNDYTPPISILKPVCGLDRGAYENFASHCRQDYPEYEILFAAQEDDPAVPVIRQVMRDFPDRSIRLMITAGRSDMPDKVAKLCEMAREARYEILVVSDSDVRVAPDYLRVVAAPFADQRLGAVSMLYRAAEAPCAGAIMDAVGSAGSFMGNLLIGRELIGVKFALGATMATRREILQEIGGFESLLDRHSEDYEFGKRVADRGYRLELVSGPMGVQFPSESLGSHLRHELRWMVGVRHIRPGGHFGMLFTLEPVWAIAAALASPTAGVAAAWLGAYLALRLANAYVIGVWGLNDRVLRRWLWLVPLYDLLFSSYWLVSFFVKHIEWRGLVFRIERGRMVPVTPRPDRA